MFVPSTVQVGLTERERNEIEVSSLEDLLALIERETKVHKTNSVSLVTRNTWPYHRNRTSGQCAKQDTWNL